MFGKFSYHSVSCFTLKVPSLPYNNITGIQFPFVKRHTTKVCSIVSEVIPSQNEPKDPVRENEKYVLIENDS